MSTDVMLREAPPMLDFAPDGEFVTLERYLEIADENEFKIEYIDGKAFEMPGVLNNHALIQTNMTLALGRLHGAGYVIPNNDMSVHPGHGMYFYPDFIIVRGAPRYASKSADLLNPALVVEVLSPSTREKDLYDKLPRYLDMPSMEHILIIEQDSVSVEHHRRVGNIWTQTTYTDIADIVALDSLGASLPLAQVYNLIEFSQA